MSAVVDAKENGKIVIKDRVCDYYLSARGCVKGEQCDFLHPVAPSGASTNRVCDFYSSPRGCSKGESCDFLHPRRISPAGEVTNRVCDYYVSETGCLKGNQCDFLHPRVLPSGKQSHRGPVGGAGVGAVAVGGVGQGVGGPRGAGTSTRVCDFYNTPTGCSKGLNCNFLHPRAGSFSPVITSTSAPTSTRKPCDYFFSRQGCKKGEECPFAHTRSPVVPSSSVPRSSYPPRAGGPGSGSGAPFKTRVCDFFATERGCVKGDQCDFIHQKDKVCDYFASARGCKKGDLCDFKHTNTAGTTISTVTTATE